VNNLVKGLDKHEQFDANLLDFKKAFGKVSDTRLLMKLDDYGIRGNTLKWVQGGSSLTEHSSWSWKAAIPTHPCHFRSAAGQRLGSTALSTVINGLPSSVKSTTGMFADDCLFDRMIKSQDAARATQDDLDSLQVWEKEWQKDVNAVKCEVIRITTKGNPIVFSYQKHQTTLT
jgi:hypothetical protein